MLSWTRPPEVIGSDLIGVDCSLANPAVLGGEVTSVPASLKEPMESQPMIILADDRSGQHKVVVSILL